MNPTNNISNELIRQTIIENYEQIARGHNPKDDNEDPHDVSPAAGNDKPRKTCCCKQAAKSYSDERKESSFAQKIGYTQGELTDLPLGANLGLSCGNPTAIASLQEGETVLDLGCGGGFDVFVAARKVGPGGKCIGIDMTTAMLHKARENAHRFEERTGLKTEFRLGEIEHLPVADGSIDVVISNCVINLSPEKEQVWKEVARVLKPGGRVCVSDIALLQPLPENLRQSMSVLVGCVAGAVLVEDTLHMVEMAGLKVISTEKESAFIREMEASEDPLSKDIMKDMPDGSNPHDYVTSLRLVAQKTALSG
jgi:Methylase involved in ubiquinone/menaquinone biosynthesis